MTARDTLFISHANPADNDFTAWIGSRLTAMGYRTWADLSDARYGTKHWGDIERVIRESAAKVIIVTSRSSREAEGVENEINIAKSVEKEYDLEDFIIQIRIDDIPFGRLPPQLNNRLAISFTGDWGRGLKSLVDQFEEENLPRPGTLPGSIDFFSSVLRHDRDELTAQREPAFASWLPIQVPEFLTLCRLPGSAGIATEDLRGYGIPCFSIRDTVVSFAKPDVLSYVLDMRISNLNARRVTRSDWMNTAQGDGFSIPRVERRRAMSGLLNSVWACGLEERGFRSREVANERAFFLPKEDGTAIKQRYHEPLGRRSRPVHLMGHSGRMGAFWHAGISAQAKRFPIDHLAVGLHVVFTEDGETVIGDSERVLQMRKTFCKMWWNDRWRRLLFALHARIADGAGPAIFGTGGDVSLEVGFPLEITVPYTIASDPAEGSPDDTRDPEDTDTPDHDLTNEGSVQRWNHDG